MRKSRILILGGTSEARQLAERLALRGDLDCLISLAGRTAEPRALPLPMRSGGFGGMQALADFIAAEKFDLLVDATHPFASKISDNAEKAALIAGIPAFMLCRPGWQVQEGDHWTQVGSMAEAVAALGSAPRRVFLAIGRQEAYQFSAAPQHRYLVRSVDPVEPRLEVPDCRYILATGPFAEEAERALLEENRIEVIVTKNSGGDATSGKLAAARKLGIEVVMIARKAPGALATVGDADAAMALIDHILPPE